MKRLALLVPLVLAACSTTKNSIHESSGDTHVATQQFETLKSLAGKWSGTATHGGENFPVEVAYRVTANGSAVAEVLFKDTPHEMVSVYHLDGDRLMMTHYCAAGNQPRMVAVTEPARVEGTPTLAFEFKDATNMSSPDELHMDAMRLWIVDQDHIRSKWMSVQDRKPLGAAEFDLTRNKPGA